jgi:hypothetical protein
MLGVIYPNNVMAISGEQMTNVLAFDGALVGSEGWI